MDEFPEHALIFWPVGCGDSTTLVVDRDADVIVQIDLHHVGESEDDDDHRTPIVDELSALLPERDGKPYLAAFGATHLDKDHIQGFADLLNQVTIGDLWFTPRVLWEQDQDELCEDAKAFVEEAERRINKLKAQGQVGWSCWGRSGRAAGCHSGPGLWCARRCLPGGRCRRRLPRLRGGAPGAPVRP